MVFKFNLTFDLEIILNLLGQILKNFQKWRWCLDKSKI